MRLRLLDIDGSLPLQPGFAQLLAAGTAQCLDLRAQEGALRLWAGRAALAALAAQLAATVPPPGRGPLVTFYGSGDYHHLATTLIAACPGPLCVLHFDNHPDWVRAPAANNCGGWVNRALELPQVARVVTLGVCSDDLVRPQLKGANLAALAAGRLEVHPWQVPPSRIWGHLPDGPGHRQVGGRLVWNCLADLDWEAFLDALLARLPAAALWITIDKDVLQPADAATNWDQGRMPLATLLAALRRIGASGRVVGVDVCGEYSAPRFADPLKRIAAWLDHPHASPPDPLSLARNDRANRALVQALAAVLG